MGKKTFSQYTARSVRWFTACAILLSTAATAGDAKIVNVSISASSGSQFVISVTIAHGDEGWDHYANRWDVFDENGELLGSRVLAHPHVDEQPFTRSLRVSIPATVNVVTIVAADSVHGDNTETVAVAIPR